MIVMVELLLPPIGTGGRGLVALGRGVVDILVTTTVNVSLPSLSVSLTVLTLAQAGPREPAEILSLTEPPMKSDGPNIIKSDNRPLPPIKILHQTLQAQNQTCIRIFNLYLSLSLSLTCCCSIHC